MRAVDSAQLFAAEFTAILLCFTLATPESTDHDLLAAGHEWILVAQTSLEDAYQFGLAPGGHGDFGLQLAFVTLEL